MTQSTIRVDGANMIELKVVDDNHGISWKVATKGRLEFVARAHNIGEYLALSVEERPYGVNARNRATFATLAKPAVWALRDMLCDTFGQPDPKANEQFAALVHLRDELRTHIDSFRKGLKAVEKFERGTGNADDAAYWAHELKALDDIEAALNKTLGLCEKCGLPQCTGECGGY